MRRLAAVATSVAVSAAAVLGMGQPAKADYRNWVFVGYNYAGTTPHFYDSRHVVREGSLVAALVRSGGDVNFLGIDCARGMFSMSSDGTNFSDGRPIAPGSVANLFYDNLC